MTLIVDRIEGDLAVVQFYGETVNIPLGDLPDGTKEGTIITLTGCLAADQRGDTEARLERLRQTGPAGDIIDL